MSAPIDPDLATDLIARNATVAEVVALFDAWGFNLGTVRISLWTALVTVIVLLALFLLARLGSRMAKRLFARITRLDSAQQLLGEKLVSILVWAFAIMVGIDLLGIDLTALAVFSGAFGLAIGFGLQKTFGNLIAGIILLMDRSIKPGDVIAVSDGTGQYRWDQVQEDRHPRGLGRHPRPARIPDPQREPDGQPSGELVLLEPRRALPRCRWAWPMARTWRWRKA